LEVLDGSLLPGTYAGNWLKKFVKQEGFYKTISPNKQLEEDPEEEENEREIRSKTEDRVIRTEGGEVTPNSQNKNETSEYLLMDFEILLPELKENWWEEYTQYIE
jgi:hypothetical protein